jgi:hypothetical protein
MFHATLHNYKAYKTDNRSYLRGSLLNNVGRCGCRNPDIHQIQLRLKSKVSKALPVTGHEGP